jgi:hypothetical protein
MNVFDDQRICYTVFYHLCRRYIAMFSFGLVCKRIYQYLCANTQRCNDLIAGLKTIDGKRHGEWIINKTVARYNNGVIIYWREYIVSVPRWCRPSSMALKCHWMKGSLCRMAGVRYEVYCWYSMGTIQFVELAGGVDMRAVLKKYDWCSMCVRHLSTEHAGTRLRPDIATIERFLVSNIETVVCPYDTYWHAQQPH